MAERRELHHSWEPILEKNREHVDSGKHRENIRGDVGEQLSDMRQRAKAVLPQVQDNDADVHEHVTKLESLEEPAQVAFLGKIALEDGAAKAVALAEKSGSPYVIDALHDLLVDELAGELERRHKKI